MAPPKGDNSDIIDSQFINQDRYRIREKLTNTYNICDKRCSRKIINSKKIFDKFRTYDYKIKYCI
jgi:hypothetical protein